MLCINTGIPFNCLSPHFRCLSCPPSDKHDGGRVLFEAAVQDAKCIHLGPRQLQPRGDHQRRGNRGARSQHTKQPPEAPRDTLTKCQDNWSKIGKLEAKPLPPRHVA